MATVNPTPATETAAGQQSASILVHLTALTEPQIENVLANLTTSFAPQELIISTSEESAKASYPTLRIVTAPSSKLSWTLSAADFVQAHQLAREHKAGAILILGPESDSLRVPVLRELARSVVDESMDLAVPRYDLSPRAALVNSAILYPVSRSLFASPVRFPMAIDLGLSMRMAERLAISAQRFTSHNQGDLPVWPVSEAAVAGFRIAEFEAGQRVIPHPAEPDLHTILPLIAGSLFADIEAKAAFWQRPRQAHAAQIRPAASGGDGPELSATDVAPMLQAFRLAYGNLLEIWSLVLPPNALLGLKRLSLTDGAAFRMSETLWARIVYDFVLAYRLRTINRGHLLGALIPLYLAWVASHVNSTASGMDPERHIEAVAAAFEAEKPYIVSRWRWPDRFNP